MEIVVRENMVSIMDHEEGRMTEEIVDDPMQIPKRITEGWSPQTIDELPDTFCGIFFLLIKRPFLMKQQVDIIVFVFAILVLMTLNVNKFQSYNFKIPSPSMLKVKLDKYPQTCFIRNTR